ncbi:bifunctional folylpolyglutamate synthase/dihydrofolate synthase [Leptolyngbya sp. NK1-12]|uniref:tetrahydrofolate synthase n=1 Tax=Leptolyngbya sp. NK1-12 TaxID=2547451 RepID=A0AA97AJY7_9CYAN|nr:folylpolyglutamate synthase/dihydrofolate synthase family protein [Leptolyngbya sp. NK1-12]WNZ23132.1 bifunctional folylpolyglutamate synthase/dihydrofolate synthase [Leptolyngbya sp. NK1-12]
MTHDQTLLEINALLDRFTHFGVELGLERIERLLAALGHPERQVPIVHVAGSNGKGSVCAYLSAVLDQAGYRVGRYTSPHLVSWCERICLNQQEIPATQLHQILLQVLAAIDPNHSSPTQFEVITAAAWLYFAQQQVDIAVIEVGLGGRLDATNVCDRPLVSIITSLSREHWQRLGPTLADISREKAGILKPNCPAVIAPQPPEAVKVLQQRLTELHCPAFWIEPSRDLGNGWAEFVGTGSEPGSGLMLVGLQYPLPLLGAHQRINSALAVAALQILQQQGWQIDHQQIVQGMAKTQWPGRLQWFEWRGHRLLIDGAHNPAGAAMLRTYLDQTQSQPIHFVMGMIGNKDHADVFQALLRPNDWLYLVPVPDHIPVDLSQLQTLATTMCSNLAGCTVYDDVMLALEDAAIQTQTKGGTLVLCGSLYLIGHFFQLQQGG